MCYQEALHLKFDDLQRIAEHEVDFQRASEKSGGHSEVEENESQRHPERAVSGKGTVAEVIAGLVLLKTRDELRQSAVEQSCAENHAAAAQAEVVKLKQEGGDAETSQPDGRRISMSFCCHVDLL